jgi:microcystin-dependent protein
MQPTINTLLDPVVNFGKTTVSTGYSNLDTVIVLNAGHGSKLPQTIDGAFNLTWYNSTTYGDPSDDPNVEIVRCTDRSGDVLTITRAQEGTLASSKNTSTKTYKMILSPTKKTITDIWQSITSLGGIPTGIISLWSGSILTIPSGWNICDGTNGTPDLRDRFIVGAGSAYAVGGTGGEATHTLTIDEIPAHTHSAAGWTPPLTRWYDTTAGSSLSYTSGFTGGDQAHENRPPYYALAYIMKL